MEKQPKVFEFYWHWYEECVSYQFYHENKTKEEFEQDVELLMKQHADEYLKRETSWAGIDSLCDFVSTKLPNLGYTPLIIFASKGYFGGTILRDDDEREKFIKVLSEKTVDDFIEHNRRVEKEMDNRSEDVINL